MLIYSYKPGSGGAKHLAQALNIRRIKHEGSRFSGARHPTVINWGASELPGWSANCRIINPPEAVAAASNKLRFFRQVSEAGHEGLLPPWTDSRDVAQRWVRDGSVVVARTILSGHSGAGIVLVHGDQDLPNAPLFVKYIKKQEEYRVHVLHGEVIDVQRKARRHDHDNPNWQVRNHQNGFIYSREGANPPARVREVALEAMACTRLDFGAVDIIWNAKEERPYVLEINTAPGLEGTTIERYANAFRVQPYVRERVAVAQRLRRRPVQRQQRRAAPNRRQRR